MEFIRPEAAVFAMAAVLVTALVIRTKHVRKRLERFLVPRGFVVDKAPPELTHDLHTLHISQAFLGPLAPEVKGLFFSCYIRRRSERGSFTDYLGVLVPSSVADAESRLGVAGAERISRQAGGVLALWEVMDTPENAARILQNVESTLSPSPLGRGSG
jgi:hypothetical protein